MLVDDLVTRGTTEPYRMFTSRAEYRLLLGVDTASRRLSAHGRRIGLLPASIAARAEARWMTIERSIERLEKERWLPDAETRRGFAELGVTLDAPASSAELLRRPEVGAEQLCKYSGVLAGLSEDDRRVTAETIKYSGYVDRQRREADRVRRAGSRRIPKGFVYRGLAGLSNELVEKLDEVRPESLGRASRICGMTPAALALLAAHLERRPERSAP